MIRRLFLLAALLAASLCVQAADAVKQPGLGEVPPPITLTAVPSTFVWSVRAYLRAGSRTIDSSFDIYGAKLEKL